MEPEKMTEEEWENVLAAAMEKAEGNANTCVCCGAEIPEGRMVCVMCETETEERLILTAERLADELAYCRACRGYEDCEKCSRRARKPEVEDERIGEDCMDLLSEASDMIRLLIADRKGRNKA